MLKIAKRFVTNEENEKIAVQIDIKTFGKIEEILENYGLAKLMQETSDEESLNIDQARKHYDKLSKA